MPIIQALLQYSSGRNGQSTAIGFDLIGRLKHTLNSRSQDAQKVKYVLYI
jgi:hypothetical protein